MGDHEARQSRRKVLVEATVDEAARVAAELLASVGCEASAARGQFTLALSGGTTPRRLYDVLAGPLQMEKVPWHDTQVFFGDERDVPADHPDSNYRMAREALLDSVPIPLEAVHPMLADATDLDAAAADYAHRLADYVPAGPDGVPVLDLVLLGMGSDGHTASLFPGTTALDETQQLVVSQPVPALGRDRMTLTFPIINAARNVLFLITGRDKAEAVKSVLDADPAIASRLPAGRVQPADGQLMFVLDHDAAAMIPHKRT